MEWDLLGGVVRVQVGVQVEEMEAEALAGWVETAPELAPAESVSVRVVGRGYNIRQVYLALIWTVPIAEQRWPEHDYFCGQWQRWNRQDIGSYQSCSVSEGKSEGATP